VGSRCVGDEKKKKKKKTKKVKKKRVAGTFFGAKPGAAKVGCRADDHCAGREREEPPYHGEFRGTGDGLITCWNQRPRFFFSFSIQNWDLETLAAGPRSGRSLR